MSQRQQPQPVKPPSPRSRSYIPKNRWWARVQLAVHAQLTRSPLLEGPATYLWRTYLRLYRRLKWILTTSVGTMRGTYARDVDTERTYWITPQRIVYAALREFNVHDFKGHVIEGDWDRLEKKFENLDIYVALKEVCLQGKAWPQTTFYRRTLARLQQGQTPWGCKDRNTLDRRCQGLEALFARIKREGYKTQSELLLAQGKPDPHQLEDEITVSIGRHGDLLFSNGAHRLAIAKLLKVPAVPVRVAVRHPQWMALRRMLQSYAVEKGGQLAQPAFHPDLDHIPARDGCEERFRIVSRHLSSRSGNLLVIDANLGYFCHRFEDEGFTCYAMEEEAGARYFMRKLRRAENRRFHVLAEPMLENAEISTLSFQVVLALNVFHRFMAMPEQQGKLGSWLENLQTDELYFELSPPVPTQTQAAYRRYSPDEFMKFLAEQTGLSRSTCIAVTRDGQSIYKLCR